MALGAAARRRLQKSGPGFRGGGGAGAGGAAGDARGDPGEAAAAAGVRPAPRGFRVVVVVPRINPPPHPAAGERGREGGRPPAPGRRGGRGRLPMLLPGAGGGRERSPWSCEFMSLKRARRRAQGPRLFMPGVVWGMRVLPRDPHASAPLASGEVGGRPKPSPAPRSNGPGVLPAEERDGLPASEPRRPSLKLISSQFIET